MPTLRSESAAEPEDKGAGKHRSKLGPPVWDRLDKTGWLEFKGNYEHYVMTYDKDGDPKEWHHCLESRLCRQIGRLTDNRLCGGTEKPEDPPEGCKLLKELKWDEASTLIDKELAPDSHAAAVDMFKSIKMELTWESRKFTIACLNYIDEFEQTLCLMPEGTIEEQEVANTFVEGIKPKAVRVRVEGQEPKDCKQAFKQLMDLAKIMKTVQENAELYKGLVGGKADTKKKHNPSQKGGEEAEESGKKTKKPFTGECHKCGKKGHKEADCYSKKHGKTGEPLMLTELEGNQNDKEKKK